MTMITSNGQDIMRMSYEQLKEERKVQYWLVRQLYRLANTEEYKFNKYSKQMEEENPHAENLHRFNKKQISLLEFKWKRTGINNRMATINRYGMKANLLRNYEEALRLFVAEIDDTMEYRKPRPKKYKKKRNVKKEEEPETYDWIDIGRDHFGHEVKGAFPREAKIKMLKKYNNLLNRNGCNFQWDKKKLLQVASDRGYASEMATAYAIEQYTELPKNTVKRILNEGKFSWGQVLVIGALFEMTPKEFCDTFLSGYFLEQPGGEWRASFDNIDKNGLLSAIPVQRDYKKNKAEADDENGTEAE